MTSKKGDSVTCELAVICKYRRCIVAILIVLIYYFVAIGKTLRSTEFNLQAEDTVLHAF
jgi:hypothetical protein